MLRLNKTAWIFRPQAANVYGEKLFGTPFKARCAVVHLIGKTDKTTVRTDSSASRGASDETLNVAKILFARNADIEVDDKVQIEGFTMRVIAKQPRFTVVGPLDHYECDLVHWVGS